jgi:Uma2 family endonuclease
MRLGSRAAHTEVSMSAQPASLASADDYLAFERGQREKHEFFDGEIVQQAGASIAHNLITANIIGSLHQQLRGKPCTVLPSDMRIRTPRRRQYMYPDATIICGSPLFDDSQHDTILNPVVIVEVLSPSTESYDRGRKFQAYRTIATLQEYLLISQTMQRVEHFQRHTDLMWLMREYTSPDQAIELTSVGCRLLLSELYEKVSLPVDDDESPPDE